MQKFLISICSVVVACTAYANTETIQWYVDGNLYDTTTCESGGDIILPTPPTKYGYTFAGWAPMYDLSTLDKNTNGDVYYAIVDKGTCYYRTSDMSSVGSTNCTDDNNFTDLSAGKWKTEFSYGTVYGDSKCSSTSGTYATSGNPVNTTGNNCWCRATGFIPDGEDVMYDPAVSLWVLSNTNSSTSTCASECAANCSDRIRRASTFRTALYGAI